MPPFNTYKDGWIKMKIESPNFLRRSFLRMIIWIILGDLFALAFFSFDFKEASPFFLAPFGGLTVAVLVISFRDISNGLIWPLTLLTWLIVLLLPALSSTLRNYPVATLRFQGIFAVLQFVFGVFLVVGSSC